MQERGIGKRQSIQNYVFFNNNSENVCNDSENISKAAQGLEKLNLAPSLNADKSCIKPLAIKRQTQRSVKKSRAPVPVHRSKSSDRGGVGAALLDNLSCISRSGRTSPVDSEDQSSVQVRQLLDKYILQCLSCCIQTDQTIQGISSIISRMNHALPRAWHTA